MTGKSIDLSIASKCFPQAVMLLPIQSCFSFYGQSHIGWIMNPKVFHRV